MRLFFFSLLSLFQIISGFAQGIEFTKGTWVEAVELAKSQNKPLFVDAYAEWCGPCKRMAATTFKDKDVGEFFNKNFINVKIDCEKPDGLKFKQKYPVSAYPTLYFIGNDGAVIHRVVGAQEVKGLLLLGEFALSKIDYSLDFATKYEKGDRSPELMFDYVTALNKSSKPSLKIANEYLRTQKDLNTPFNLKFILEATTEADSRIFDLLVEKKKALEELVGSEYVQKKIEHACEKTSTKAAEYKSADLLNDAIGKMEKHLPAKAKAFTATSKLKYYLAVKDAKNYLKSSSSFYQLIGKNSHESLHKHCQEIQSNFSDDANCMKQAEKYAKEAAAKSDFYDYYLTYASILQSNGKNKDALVAALKAMDLAKKSQDLGGEKAAGALIESLKKQ
jgi:thiol-disulfide isomerase/thioredoxin